MGITDYSTPPGNILRGVPNLIQQLLPCHEAGLSMVHGHQLSLPEMDGFNTAFHIPAGEVVKEQPCLLLCDIGHATAAPPVIHQMSIPVKHCAIGEITLFSG